MPCRYKSLFIRKRDILPGFDRLDRGQDADHPHNGSHQDLRFRLRRHGKEPVHPGKHTHIQIPYPALEFHCFFLIPYSGKFRAEFPDLRFEKFNIAPCCQGCYLDIFVRPYDLKGLCPDGPGRPENSYLFHIILTSFL